MFEKSTKGRKSLGEFATPGQVCESKIKEKIAPVKGAIFTKKTFSSINRFRHDKFCQNLFGGDTGTGEFAAPASRRNDLDVVRNFLFQSTHMRNHADQFIAAFAETMQKLYRPLQFSFIQGAESLVKEQRIDSNALACERRKSEGEGKTYQKGFPAGKIRG